MQLFVLLLLAFDGHYSAPQLEGMQRANKLHPAVILATANERDLERILSKDDSSCIVHVPVDASSPITAIITDINRAEFVKSIISLRFSGRGVRVFVGKAWVSE